MKKASLGTLATASAARVEKSTRAISPKKALGSRMARASSPVAVCLEMRTVPSITMYSPSPASPSRKMTSSAR